MAKKQAPAVELVIRNKRSGFTTKIPRDQFEAHDEGYRSKWEVLSGEAAPSEDEGEADKE
jgi:hypothetical protein